MNKSTLRKAAARLTPPILLLAITTGCTSPQLYTGSDAWPRSGVPTQDWTTAAMWDKLDKVNRAAPDPQLRLYRCKQPDDVLVQYTEQIGARSLQTRSYLLFADRERVARGRKPRFLTKIHLEGMEAIPVVKVRSLDVHAPINGDSYAVLPSGGPPFELVLDGRSSGTFPLPSYPNPQKQALAIVLTPFTAAFDVVLAASYAMPPQYLAGPYRPPWPDERAAAGMPEDPWLEGR